MALRGIKRPFVWLGGIMGLSVAPALECSRPPIELPIVSEGDEVVKLIEILPGDLMLFKPEDYDHVWCLAVDDSSFTLGQAVDWIAATREANMKSSKRFLPTILLLVNLKEVSRDALHEVTNKLIRTGVLLVRWPEGASSVHDAFAILRSELQESYGEPNFNQQVRWGQAPLNASHDMIHAM